MCNAKPLRESLADALAVLAVAVMLAIGFSGGAIVLQLVLIWLAGAL